MRKFLMIAAFVLAAAVSVTAQTRKYDYDSGQKYGLFSNLEIGAAGAYSIGLNEAHHQNFGAELLVTKRIGDYWRIRGVAEVNGLVKNGFDRYAKGMFGVSFDLLPFYLFADYGAAYNPSAASSFGLAMDGGIGLQFKVGGGSLYTEAAVDRVNGGTQWQSNASVKVGYLAHLGITERDRVAVDIDNNMRSEYGELKQQNSLMKSELQKCTEASATMQAAAEQMQKMVLSLQERCQTLEKEKIDAKSKAVDYSMFKFHFDYASIYLSEIQESRVATLASYINSTEGQWRVDGYASPDGSDYNNMVISQQRAENVCALLQAYGVDEKRLIPIGNGSTYEYGEDSPLNRMVVVSKVKP